MWSYTTEMVILHKTRSLQIVEKFTITTEPDTKLVIGLGLKITIPGDSTIWIMCYSVFFENFKVKKSYNQKPLLMQIFHKWKSWITTIHPFNNISDDTYQTNSAKVVAVALYILRGSYDECFSDNVRKSFCCDLSLLYFLSSR